MLNRTNFKQSQAFLADFNNRQKDIAIGIHLSRILSEMRYRVRIDHRKTDFDLINNDYKLTHSTNMVMLELTRYIDNVTVHEFLVCSYWDREQGPDVFLRVFRFIEGHPNMHNSVIDIDIMGMARMEAVRPHGDSSVGAALHARNVIRESFKEIGVDF